MGSAVTLTQYHGDLQPLIDWVRFTPLKRSQNATARQDEPPTDFMEFVRSALPTDGYYKFWSNRVSPNSESNGKWLRGFPHVHAWDEKTWTMICYLTACEGGEILVADHKHMRHAESVSPAPGLCVMVNGNQWHGIRPVLAGERLAIIITAFRAGDAKE
jgi:hypothetical protein